VDRVKNQVSPRNENEIPQAGPWTRLEKLEPHLSTRQRVGGSVAHRKIRRESWSNRSTSDLEWGRVVLSRSFSSLPVGVLFLKGSFLGAARRFHRKNCQAPDGGLMQLSELLKRERRSCVQGWVLAKRLTSSEGGASGPWPCQIALRKGPTPRWSVLGLPSHKGRNFYLGSWGKTLDTNQIGTFTLRQGGKWPNLPPGPSGKLGTTTGRGGRERMTLKTFFARKNGRTTRKRRAGGAFGSPGRQKKPH